MTRLNYQAHGIGQNWRFGIPDTCIQAGKDLVDGAEQHADGAGNQQIIDCIHMDLLFCKLEHAHHQLMAKEYKEDADHNNGHAHLKSRGAKLLGLSGLPSPMEWATLICPPVFATEVQLSAIHK